MSAAGGTAVRAEGRPGPVPVLRHWPAVLGLASAAFATVVAGDRDSAVNAVCVAVVAGSVLVAHAVWDLVHLRRGVVVPRSLAEACISLDVPLGIAVIALALG
jgi:hypothetical protein